MRALRVLLACLVALALVVTGSALADRGDPQKKITSADQARARAMLLRKADLGPGFQATRGSSDSSDVYCKALDLSDLTLTGDADALFRTGLSLLVSGARVYETLADANTAWRRNTSAAGIRCLRGEFARELASDGGALLSFERIAFPKLGERTSVYRLVARSEGIKLVADLVTIQRSRAHAGAFFFSGLTPVPKEKQLSLLRVIDRRMATAMRGA